MDASNISDAPAPQFSRRLRQVVRLVTLGCTSKEIGRLLYLSDKTIETHRNRAMEISGVHNIAQLTRVALALGITSLADRLTDTELARLSEIGSTRHIDVPSSFAAGSSVHAPR